MKDRAHGIMFHHFYDENKHIPGQGAITGEKFNDMLEYYGRTHNIISAEEYLYKSMKIILSSKDVCLTFDDGLLCQFDIAYPIMKQRGLTAFWFIYTSPMDGVLESLEVYRHFRVSQFIDIEDFYMAFFEIASKTDEKAVNSLKTFKPEEYLKECPFYTPNDKRFRYLRDYILGENKYNEIMNKMMAEYNYDIWGNARLLWINSQQIKELHNSGHIIGLHSYSHPTVMIKKDIDEQEREYRTNKNQLEEIINDKVISVSYPCNSYNIDTLKCMSNLDIKIGFRANMVETCLGSVKLENPREDHANIIREMERKG